MPHKLLLADDSVTIQRVIELTFADEDVKVVAVSDGDQAIARIEAEPPDVVLADVGMPGKDGYEVAAHVKRTPALAHIPVVLLTGAFEPVDQARLAAAGCDGVLPKPFEPQQVIARVRELLDRNGSAHAGAAFAQAAPAAAPAPGGTAAAVASQPGRADLDDYFDRLDSAFAKLDAPLAGGGAAADISVADQIDWFATHGAPAAAGAPIDPPLSFASPPPELAAAAAPIVVSPAPVPVAAPPAPAPVQEASPAGQAVVAPLPIEPAPAALPPLDQAFAALLAAEQHGGLPEASWPGIVSAPAPAPPSDELVAQVAERVLAALADRADRVVRDAVAELVSQTAERLVREEIERIKASIK